MSYVDELDKATAGILVETAKKLAQEFRASITAREQNRQCACGKPCRNPYGHEAADRLALIAVEEVLLNDQSNSSHGAVR